MSIGFEKELVLSNRCQWYRSRPILLLVPVCPEVQTSSILYGRKGVGSCGYCYYSQLTGESKFKNNNLY